jgi:hypothetical protein
MTKKILIAGFACLSVIAIGQSSGNKDQAASTASSTTTATAKDAHPKDVASGQASGKVVAPRDLSTGHASGKVASRPAGSQATLNSSDPATPQVTAPRDMATGQASGKRQYQPIIIRKVSEDDAVAEREQASPKATGKTSATDDWQAPAAAKPEDANSNGVSSNGQARVTKGDVNGDGRADAAINNSHSNIKNPREAASGQASGKRIHSDITITKEVGPAPQK